MSSGARVLICAVVLLAATAQPDPSELELPGRLASFLEDGEWDVSTVSGFRIIALSNIADGCAYQAKARPARVKAAAACVDRALELGWRMMPARKLDSVSDGLWLSHLNLIYGARHLVGGCADPVKHELISKRLVALSMADPFRTAPSFGSVAMRWPADQSATLASLARYDLGHGTALGVKPLADWEAVITSKHLDPSTKLPRSELTGKGPGAKHPRGCAQSFISRYLAEADPVLSKAWWESYRAEWLVEWGGVTGFREWPRGVERGADLDSGPIVFGMGIAASALGISAARAQGEPDLAARLERTADTVTGTGLTGPLPFLLLPQALRFEAKWQPDLTTPR